MQTDALTQALYENYLRSGHEAGYWGSYFLRALKKHGGLALAKRMLVNKSKGGETKGFLALADAGRPDLSIEAVVLAPKFRHLFTKEEIATAEKRLSRFPKATLSGRRIRTLPYPDELDDNVRYRDGAVARVHVNRYERDPKARAACLARHGTHCKVCGLNWARRDGKIGAGFIHVHHVKPLGMLRRQYELNPKTDLVPVCPNCHAMLHTRNPPFSIAELRKMFRP